MAIKKEFKLALEAARGAVITVHAAAGLAADCPPTGRQALRLLRSSEGLCRAAVAILLSAEASAGQARENGSAAVVAGQGTSRSATRRRRRAVAAAKKNVEKKVEKVKSGMDLDEGELVDPASASTIAASCPPGGSVVLGDLSEFGIGATRMVVGTADGSDGSDRVRQSPAVSAPSSVALEPDLADLVRRVQEQSTEALRSFDEALIRLAASKGIGKDGRPTTERRRREGGTGKSL